MKDRKKRIAHTDETKAIKKDVETANAALLEGGFKIMVYWSRKAVALCVLVPSVKLSAQKKWRQALGWWV
jgi:tRNA1(Val) A37 N6-methylase TrmN6